MRSVLYCGSLVVAMVAAGCGDATSPPQSPPSGDTISGGERLAWIQPGAPEEIQTYQYALYVDGERRVLQSATCNPTGSGAADCTAPVPALPAGRHSLQLAAFFTLEGRVVEGPRSAALQVSSQGLVGTARASTIRGGEFATPDGLALRAEILADDLVAPSDVAVAPDGRVFVAERGGTIRMVDGAARTRTGTPTALIASGRDGDRATLLSIALDRQFSTTGVLYAAYATVDRDRPAVRVVRMREAGGMFGESAAITNLATRAMTTAAVVRLGPDGMLYIAIGAADEPESAQQLSEPAGKLLRIRPDGSTPDDNPASSPVFSTGHGQPRGLAWQSDGSLWEAERGETGDEINRIAAGANYGWPIGSARVADPDTTQPAMLMPAESDVAGMAILPAGNHPLAGAFIVSAAAAEDLLVLRPGLDARPPVTVTLLGRRFGRIGPVAADTNGALYFVTANEHHAGGRDALIRLQPGDR